MLNRPLLAPQLLLLTCLSAAPALAGIPECGDVRLEDVGSCRIQGSVECSGGCSQLGVYKKACATKLHTVCREECTLSANPTCTDSCTEGCSSECDLGINVICSHNCFGECVGSCDASCATAADPETCRASCEATCDGECDLRCRPVVNASCYQHCVECCGGSCQAQANMDCQTTCQEESFEDCEHELRVDCDASCSADGALFCDGKYVISGSELPACAQALISKGIGDLDLNASGSASIGLGSESGGVSSAGCALSPAAPSRSPFPWWGATLAVALLGASRRRHG